MTFLQSEFQCGPLPEKLHEIHYYYHMFIRSGFLFRKFHLQNFHWPVRCSHFFRYSLKGCKKEWVSERPIYMETSATLEMSKLLSHSENGVFWVVTPWKPQILHSIPFVHSLAMLLRCIRMEPNFVSHRHLPWNHSETTTFLLKRVIRK
jgi:hypothetical protein